MTVFCTYCSKEKDDSPGKMKALDRYQSDRIQSVYAASVKLDYPFYILSGQFGLLKHSDLIDYYDHLLTVDEVEGHSMLVAEQFEKLQIKSIVVFGDSIEADPNLNAYYDCIRMASAKQNVELTILQLPVEDHFLTFTRKEGAS